MPPDTPEARELTKSFSAAPIAQNIANDKNSRATKLATLVSTCQKRLTAGQTILDNSAASEAVKIGKDAITTLLAPAKDIVDILDLLSSVHPAISVAVGVIKVVVQLELNRLNNDKRIAALYFAMLDLLFVLADLDRVFKDNDSLEKQLKSITNNINKFGNFCDEYYKHKSYVRTILSARYKGHLATFATTFADHKTELQFLITVKSAETVTAISKNVEKLIAFLIKKSPAEWEAVDMVETHGGVEAVVKDEKLLNDIALKLGEKMNSDIRKDMMFTLRLTLDEALIANQTFYDLKFNALQSQIEHAIARSTETILSRLDSGYHNLIQDEDIRAVWKAVHHHFSQKFLSHQLTTGVKHSDFWTLNYMSEIIFYPAIGDAIDEDGSGYLSVVEVNNFFEKKPKEWSSCEWIAYWATSWYKNTIIYKTRCLALLDSLEASQATLLPKNKLDDELKWYFNDRYALPSIRIIVESIYTNILGFLDQRFTEGHDRLHVLRNEQMTYEIEMMQAQLEKPKYQLKDVDSVLAICGTKQMELSFMCLTYLLLSRHKKIMDLARTYVLSDEEFWTMSASIYHLQGAFNKRYRELMEGWRQQRLDISVQLESYASGMFEDWHNEFYDNSYDSHSEDEESGFDKGNNKAKADAAVEEAADGDVEKSEVTLPDTLRFSVSGFESEPNAVVSMVGAHAPIFYKKFVDPRDILVCSLPDQPRMVWLPLEEDEQNEDGVSVTPKKRKQTKLEQKVTALGTKLNSIEKLLREVLSAINATAQPSNG